MRRVGCLIAISLAIALSAHADDARIYTINESRSSDVSKSLSISESSARYIIQHRIQPPGGSSLGFIDEKTADLLNAYGGQQSLFAGDDGSSRPHSLVILDGVSPGVVFEGHHEPDLRVPDLSLEVLMQDVAASLRDVDSGSRKDIRSCTLRTDQYASDEAPEKRLDCLSQSPILNALPLQQKKELLTHVETLDWVEIPRNELSTLTVSFKANHANEMEVLNSLVAEMSRLASRGEHDFTVILLPCAEQSSHMNTTLRPRSRMSEVLLSDSLRTPDSYEMSYEAESAAEPVGIPSALMPICHSSNSSCMEATNGCSGHGTCYKKYSTKGEGDCYAWVSIVVAAAAMSAVFMLFSIGQQELPSVLGAGVGAPKSK